ncbi:MAG: DUF3568 family protein [Deltaproteobacteria bacterium]|nr:DUF3568 family protein [Deltaproteobacteria bacterium]
MRVRSLALVVAVLVWAGSLTGCGALLLGGAAAGGTYSYVSGRMKVDHSAGLDVTYAAAKGACDKLNLNITSSSKDLTSASIVAKDGDREVWINLKYKSDTVTHVEIKVGLMGDENASHRIYQAF